MKRWAVGKDGKTPPFLIESASSNIASLNLPKPGLINRKITPELHQPYKNFLYKQGYVRQLNTRYLPSRLGISRQPPGTVARVLLPPQVQK